MPSQRCHACGYPVAGPGARCERCGLQATAQLRRTIRVPEGVTWASVALLVVAFGVFTSVRWLRGPARPGSSEPSSVEPATAWDPAAYRGKYVVLDFWATWCGPCRHELPNTKRFAKELRAREDVALVGISLDTNCRALKQYVERRGIWWPQVCDGKGFRTPAAREHRITGIPEYVLLDPEGAVVRHADELSELREALDARDPSAELRPQGAVAITGTLLFDGALISDVTTAPPHLWFRNEETGKEAPLAWSVHGSQYAVRDAPPGTYGMSVTVDANPDNPSTYPGDYTAWEGKLEVEAGRPALTQDVTLRRVIRLLEPVDTLRGLPQGHDDPHAAYASPVRFRWEPLASATAYRCAIQVDEHGQWRPIKQAMVAEPAWSVALPPTPAGGYYLLSITALHGDLPIGMLEVHGKNYRAWDYRFVIE